MGHTSDTVVEFRGTQVVQTYKDHKSYIKYKTELRELLPTVLMTAHSQPLTKEFD